jgi:hypothetical protein
MDGRFAFAGSRQDSRPPDLRNQTFLMQYQATRFILA